MYTAMLNKKLKDIRDKYMGQEKRLTEMVTGGEGLPPRLLAEHVAQILMLQTGRVRGLDEDDAGTGLRWLKKAVEYLLARFPKEDHKLASVMLLVRLDSDLLKDMLEGGGEEARVHVLINIPNYLPDCMEEAIWMLMEEEDKNWKRLEKEVTL